MTTLAGLAGTSGSADGTGSAARFNYPYGVATDAAGNVYVADFNNNTIRKVTSTGVVSTLAGMAARFGSPCGVATDASGNVYVADTGNSTIRKITPAGVVTTLAGLVSPNGVDGGPGSADGTGSAARFSNPYGVATDASGNVYVADTGNNGIRKGFIPPPRFSAYYATTNGGFVFQISGLTNRACQIETSTNLNSPANWLPIYTNIAPFWYTNFDIGADTQRFYRATLTQ